MNMTWINRSVYTLLERIGNFQFYFMEVAKWFAAICFLMALGMACVKIFLNACDARNELIKLGLTVITYLIMLYFFPIAMRNLLSFGMNMGYGAVFSQGLYSVDLSTTEENSHLKTSQVDFYNWLDENTGGIFSTTTYEDEDSIRTALNFNIVDEKTGYIDLNKTFLYIMAFVKIAWKCFPKLTLFKISLTALGVCVVYLFAIILVVVCYFVVLINYIMCLIDYFALMGYGILMIPLSLWDGTKSYTQAILGAIGKILIKLIVISSLMFLSIMSVVDIFTQVYMHSLIVLGQPLAVEIDDLLSMSVTLLFQAPLLAVITMQTEKIANFLSSGNPQLSFGDFALGAAQSAAMAGGAAHAGKSVTNAMGVAGSAVSSAIVSGKAAKDMGGGGKSIAKSAMSGAASTVGGSLKHAAMNTPSSLSNGINDFSRMSGMQRANGGEAFVPSISRDNGGQSGSGPASLFSGNSGGGSPTISTGGGGSTPSAQNMSNGLTDNKESSEGMSNPVASSQESGNGENNNGINGVYGNADGNMNSINDSATAFANKMAGKDDAVARGIGDNVGSISSAINTIKDTHNEHKEGNKVGNGYAKNLVKNYATARLAASANAYGGSRVSFAKGDKKAPEALRGQSATIFSKGLGAQSVMMSNGQLGTNKYTAIGNEKFNQALSQSPKDSDAVDNVKAMSGEVLNNEKKEN